MDRIAARHRRAKNESSEFLYIIKAGRRRVKIKGHR